MQNLTQIVLLELGDNRIRQIKGIEHMANLKELYLGKNKIDKIEGIDRLTGLKKLSLPVGHSMWGKNVTKIFKSRQID